MHDLVIFDCDGVLVDSELIFGRVLGECLIATGLPTTIDEAVALGLGKNRVTLSAAVETRFGRKLPDAFFELFAARSTDAFERELRPMPGVEELLAALPTPRCVLSCPSRRTAIFRFRISHMAFSGAAPAGVLASASPSAISSSI